MDRQIDRHTERLSLLARTSQRLLISMEPERDLLASIFGEIGRLLGMEMLFHYRLADETCTLRLDTSDGVSEADRVRFATTRFGDLWCGRVAESRTRLVVEDLQHCSQVGSEELAAAGATSYAGFPLVSGTDLLGTVAFVSRRQTHFLPGDIEIIQTACDMLAASIARRRTEEALQRSEGRLRLAAEVAGLGVIEIDYAADTSTPDAIAASLFGLEEGVPVQRSFVHSRFHPDDRPNIEPLIQQCLDPTQGGCFAMEHRIILPDGSTRWLHVKQQVVFGEINGVRRPVSGMVAAVDVTASKKAENEFRSTFDHAAVGVANIGLDGRWLRVNRRLCEMVGYGFEELQERTFQDITHPDDLDTDLDYVRRLLAGEITTYSLEKRYIRKDRSHIWINLTVSLVRTHGGKPDYFISVVEDISTRRRAEERQRLLSEAAAVLLSTDEPDAMLKGLFAKIAPAFGLDVCLNFMVDETGTGLQNALCIGLSEDVLLNIERIEFGQAVCGNVAVTRQPAHFCCIQQSDDPRVQLVKSLGISVYACNPLVSGEVVFGTLSFASRTRDEFATEELAFFTTISQYVTAAYERLRLIGQLRDADRKKDEFLATLAHELRNPLAPIRNGLQVIKMAGGDAEAVESCRSMMERQAAQMTRLIEDLMDLSRISQGKIALQKSRMKLADAIQDAVDISRPLVEERCHELVVDLSPAPLYVDADRTRLAQVFSNLLNNAAKYTDTGGRIRVGVECQGSDVVVKVQDNGMGIPAHMLPKVFEMFTQVDRSLEKSQGGLGIGLNIVKRLVEKHGGSIVATSDGHGAGSCFVVRLPLVPSVTNDKTDEINRIKDAKPKLRRILVVDDNVDGAATSVMLLNLMGNETQSAHDGLEAVAAAETFKPDVILMDIGMPKLNGHDACRRIREQPGGKNFVIVACTGWGQEDDKRKSQESGFNFHMTKPIDPSALEKMLTELDDKKE